MPVSIKTPAQINVVPPPPPPPGLTVTTMTLPTAVVGGNFSAQLYASGGLGGPYTFAVSGAPGWLTAASSGALSGSAPGAGTWTLGVTASDASGTSPAVNLTLTAAVVVATAPRAIFQGPIQTDSAVVTWWPPASGPLPDSYNVYRDGTQLYAGVTMWHFRGGDYGRTPQLWYRDIAVVPGTTYSYTVTAVVGGAESPQSLPLSITVPSGTTPDPPIPPTLPAYPAWSLPVGGTTWTASNPATTATAGTGPQGANGCTFLYALQNCNINGGDVIVLSSGVTYATRAYTLPAFTGTNGWTYIVSDATPEYQAGGTLPALSLNPSQWVSAQLTGPTPVANFDGMISGTTLTVANVVGTIVAGAGIDVALRATFSGTIAGNTLTVTTPPTNVAPNIIAIGARLTGSGVPANTTITAGSGDTWTLSNSANISTAVSMVAAGAMSTWGGASSADPVTTALGTVITGGAGTSWTVNNSQTLGCPMTAGAVSANLAAPWPHRTGMWITAFKEGLNQTEYRCVKFTNGSTAISWTGGALGFSADATIWLRLGNYVTPMDAPAMPCLQFNMAQSSGQGLGISPACSNVRCVGLNLAPVPNDKLGSIYNMVSFQIPNLVDAQNNIFLTYPPARNIYFDRCLMGNDSTRPDFSLVGYGMLPHCDNFFTTQCYMYGFFRLNGADSYCMCVLGGKGQRVCYNFLEAASESLITGGAWLDGQYVPQDIERGWNDCFKQPMWGTRYAPTLGVQVKNHLELKIGHRILDHDNHMFISWRGATGGQWGRCCVYTARGNTSNGILRSFNGTLDGTTLTFNGWTSNPAGRMLLRTNDFPGTLIRSTTINSSAGGVNAVGAPPFETYVLELLSGTQDQPGSTYLVSTSTTPAITANLGGSNCTAWSATNPFANITDVDNYNNVAYQVCSYGFFMTADYDIACHSARIRFRNNLAYLHDQRPLSPNAFGTHRGLWFVGMNLDFIWDHNTVYGPNGWDNAIYTATFWYNNNFYAGGGWTPNDLVSRLSRSRITNSLGDMVYYVSGDGVPTGANALNTYWPGIQFTNNNGWNYNLSIQDTRALPANVYKVNGDYTQIGFAAWPGSNMVDPVPESVVNVTGNDPATSAPWVTTDGLPIGCTFP